MHGFRWKRKCVSHGTRSVPATLGALRFGFDRAEAVGELAAGLVGLVGGLFALEGEADGLGVHHSQPRKGTKSRERR